MWRTNEWLLTKRPLSIVRVAVQLMMCRARAAARRQFHARSPWFGDLKRTAVLVANIFNFVFLCILLCVDRTGKALTITLVLQYINPNQLPIFYIDGEKLYNEHSYYLNFEFWICQLCPIVFDVVDAGLLIFLVHNFLSSSLFAFFVCSRMKRNPYMHICMAMIACASVYVCVCYERNFWLTANWK